MRRHRAGRGPATILAGGRFDRRIGGLGPSAHHQRPGHRAVRGPDIRRRATTTRWSHERCRGCPRSPGRPPCRGGHGCWRCGSTGRPSPPVPRRRHHAWPVEGHRRMVRARLAGPAPPVQQGHPVAQGRRRQQQLRPVRPSQASPRGRPQTRHRDPGLQPLHDHRAAVRHQLPGRDARPDDLDPRGEALPRRARPRTRPQPRSRPRQLLICTKSARRVPQGGKCYTEEYGDMWDAMGISSRPYSVPVLRRLGWAGRIASAAQSDTWTLRDAAHTGSGIQALRVPSGRCPTGSSTTPTRVALTSHRQRSRSRASRASRSVSTPGGGRCAPRRRPRQSGCLPDLSRTPTSSTLPARGSSFTTPPAGPDHAGLPDGHLGDGANHPRRGRSRRRTLRRSPAR